MKCRGALLGSAASVALLISYGGAWAQTDAETPDTAAEAAASSSEAAQTGGGATGVEGAAQEQNADVNTVDELVVTGTGRPAVVTDVPYNFSAVRGTDIEARGIVDAPELLQSVPGVSVVDRGYRNSSVFNGVFIRGVNVDGSANGDQWVSSVSTVSTYVNNTPMFANFVLNDIDRVEVLRGPQGTLYGSGSLGGTVRYILREPDPSEFAGRAGVTVTKVDESESFGWGWSGMLNIPLGDKAAFRLNGTLLDYPGLTDYPNVYVLDEEGLPVAPDGILSPNALYRRVEDADTADISYFRASLLLEPLDNLRFLLSHVRQSDDIGGRRQWTRGKDGFGRQYERAENGSVLLEPSSRDANLTSLESTLDLGFATVTSSTSYYDHAGDSISENTGLYAQAGFLAFYYNYPRPMQPATRHYSDQALIQELRVVSDTGGAFDYIAGIYYQDEEIHLTHRGFLRGYKRWFDLWWPPETRDFFVLSDNDFVYDRNEDFRDLAVYGELTWRPRPDMQITGGIRWFDYTSESITAIKVGLYSTFSHPLDALFKVSDSKVLFKLNYSWDINPDTKLYSTISQGYRRGGANAIPQEGCCAESPAWQNYGPDEVVNYELGLKGEFGPFRYNGALFYIDWDNVQLATGTTNHGYYAVQNGGGARTRGVELELSGNLFEDLRYTAGYTYVDAKLTEDMYTPDLPGVFLIARAGAQLPGSPEHSANIAAEYSRPLTQDISWSIRGSGYYQSSTQNSIGFRPRFNATFPAFQIWNASTTFSRGDVDLTFLVKNIFNDEATTCRFTEVFMGTRPEVGYFGNGSKDCVALPRTIGASVNVKF